MPAETMTGKLRELMAANGVHAIVQSLAELCEANGFIWKEDEDIQRQQYPDSQVENKSTIWFDYEDDIRGLLIGWPDHDYTESP